MTDQLDLLAPFNNYNSSASTISPKKKYSRDEMNLAEFPLSVLSTRVSPGKKTLEFQDIIFDKSGKPVTRQWIITAADKFGLPTSSDDEVLLGLLKLSVDSGLDRRKVYFTRYELLKILRWSTEGRSYTRLSNALDRLSGVRIKATNSFFDNETKGYSTLNFGIIDAYELHSTRSGNGSNNPSFFIWSEALFKSFRSGFIKKLDFDFFLQLESAVTKRLYRFLDKHFWYRTHFKLNLFTLAHEKIGISRTFRFPSSIRQQIDPAAEELIERGFLADVIYSGKGKHTEVTFVAAGVNGARSKGNNFDKLGADRESSSQNSRLNHNNHTESLLRRDYNIAEQESLINKDLQPPSKALNVSDLINRGIKRPQAERIVSRLSSSSADFERALAVVNHFDFLVSKKSELVSRNAPGFLYRALEDPWRFVLPDDNKKLSQAGSTAFIRENDHVSKEKTLSNGNRSEKEESIDNRRSQELKYLTERKRALLTMRSEVEPEVLNRIQKEVESALSNIKELISEEGFKEAISHGVEEKLAKLFAYPDFQEWLKSNR